MPRSLRWHPQITARLELRGAPPSYSDVLAAVNNAPVDAFAEVRALVSPPQRSSHSFLVWGVGLRKLETGLRHADMQRNSLTELQTEHTTC